MNNKRKMKKKKKRWPWRKHFQATLHPPAISAANCAWGLGGGVAPDVNKGGHPKRHD
jgi:hypothetical protein